MKLHEIKQGLIDKFFKTVNEGIPLHEVHTYVISSGSILSESCKESTEILFEQDLSRQYETDSIDKAFNIFTNDSFNTLLALDESGILPRVVYLSVREYRKCSHINCMEGSPIPTNTSTGYVRKAITELKQLNEDIKFIVGRK